MEPKPRAYGLEPNTTPLDNIEVISEKYLETIRSIQTEGPYNIAGHCFGGVVANNIAEQLKKQKRRDKIFWTY